MNTKPIQIKELLLTNYRHIEHQYACHSAKNRLLTNPSDEWWEHVTSDEFPPLKSGKVYQPHDDNSLNTSLWLAWRTAHEDKNNRVIILASDISAESVSMHLWALISRCSLLELAGGSFDAEAWRKLATTAGAMADTNILIDSIPDDAELTIKGMLHGEQADLLILINTCMSLDAMTEVAVLHDVPVVNLAGIADVSLAVPCNATAQKFLCSQKNKDDWYKLIHMHE